MSNLNYQEFEWKFCSKLSNLWNFLNFKLSKIVKIVLNFNLKLNKSQNLFFNKMSYFETKIQKVFVQKYFKIVKIVFFRSENLQFRSKINFCRLLSPLSQTSQSSPTNWALNEKKKKKKIIFKSKCKEKWIKFHLQMISFDQETKSSIQWNEFFVTWECGILQCWERRWGGEKEGERKKKGKCVYWEIKSEWIADNFWSFPSQFRRIIAGKLISLVRGAWRAFARLKSFCTIEELFRDWKATRSFIKAWRKFLFRHIFDIEKSSFFVAAPPPKNSLCWAGVR